jgi:hypothetical protein
MIAGLIAIHGDLFAPTANYRAAVGRNLSVVGHLAARDKLLVLLGDVEVFARELTERVRWLARWIVKFSPRILSTHDQIGQQHSGDSAVSHPIAGVPSRDVNVLVAGIVPNKGE